MKHLLAILLSFPLALVLWSCQPKADEPFHGFWLGFQEALETADAEQLAEHVYFPLRGAPLILGQQNTVMSREEFLQQYDQLFDPQTREKLLALSSGQLESYVVAKDDFSYLMGIPEGYTVYMARLDYEKRPPRAFHFSPHDASFKLHFMDPRKE